MRYFPIIFNNGEPDPNRILALFITLNIICLFIYIIKSIIWVLIKKDFGENSYFQYVIWDDISIHVNTVVFITINVIAFIIYLSSVVFNLLNLNNGQ